MDDSEEIKRLREKIAKDLADPASGLAIAIEMNPAMLYQPLDYYPGAPRLIDLLPPIDGRAEHE